LTVERVGGIHRIRARLRIIARTGLDASMFVKAVFGRVVLDEPEEVSGEVALDAGSDLAGILVVGAAAFGVGAGEGAASGLVSSRWSAGRR
jgi:hypothetical protein